MDKDVIISIKGTQTLAGGDRDAVELVTPGRYSTTENGWKITYMESEMTGLANTETTVRVDGDAVTLTRRGGVNSEMVFRQGKRHLSLYETEFGSLAVGVDVSRIKCTLGERGGELEIKYSIDVDNSPSGKNAFKIKVREPHRGYRA